MKRKGEKMRKTIHNSGKSVTKYMRLGPMANKPNPMAYS